MKMIQEAQREDHQLLQMIIGYPECQIIPEDLAVAMQVTSQAQRGYWIMCNLSINTGTGEMSSTPAKEYPVGEPFKCISMDFKEFDINEKENRYALVFQDYLIKWPEVYSVQDQKAPTVASCLADLVWWHGVPTQTIYDSTQISIWSVAGHSSYPKHTTATNIWGY